MMPVDASAKPTLQFPTKIVLLVLLAFAYLVVGGAIFAYVEADYERAAEKEVRRGGACGRLGKSGLER